MEKGSEGSKGLHKEAWKDEIDATKAGAGYFLSIKGRPEFNPSEYISFRGLTLSEAQRLLPAEWVGWIQDLKTSTYEHVQRRAVSAPTMTVDDIYNFYKTRILDHHELEILGESSQQVVSGGHQLASLLQERQRLTVPGPASDAITANSAPINEAGVSFKLAAEDAPRATGVSCFSRFRMLASQKHPGNPRVELKASSTTPCDALAVPLPSAPSGSATANSTMSTTDDSAAGMSAERVSPSYARPPPSYFGAAVNSNPTGTPATATSTTIAGSAADLNTSAAVPRRALKSNTLVSGLGSVADSRSIPGPLATTDGLSPAHSNRIAVGTPDRLPGSPGTIPASPPADDQATNINAEERAILLSQIEEITHTCAPQEDEVCSTCLFKEYQRLCADALTKDQLKITEIADVVSLMGPTERMKSLFPDDALQASIKSGAITTAEWDTVEFDERLPMKAVKLCLQDRKDDVAAALVPMNKDHRPIRIMLETLLEYLPKDEDRSISEYEYTVKHIGPVMQAFFESGTVTSHFPNKDSVTQKKLGLKPDRPDFTATAGKTEIAWGEFSGPAHENDKWKNLWDFFRDVRYGKAFLDSGFEMAPLFQIVYEVGNYMRLRAGSRGMYVLHEVGKFTIPTTTAMVPSLIATFSTLLIAKKDIEDIAKGPLNVLKRSWGYQDLDKSNMAHIQRPSSGQKKRKSTSNDPPSPQQNNNDRQVGQDDPGQLEPVSALIADRCCIGADVTQFVTAATTAIALEDS
ncbi:hypothetical protein BGX26_005202 [Mortierella sp. AD094]|nr:hypothetical protein BGX26_005202 [Mortierella sp. AD094]